MKTEDKILKIREHFYATNLSKTDFHKQFFEMYGYQNADSLRKFMIKKNITSKDRSLQEINKIIPPVVANYNLETLDNFGIEESIGKEYVSAKLPPHLKKIGILSDIHFPYHDLTALTCAIRHLKEENIDCLYLNGDVQDFFSISRHETSKDARNLSLEVDMNRDFLQKLRDIFRTIPIYYKLGNHENRFARMLIEMLTNLFMRLVV